MWRRINCNAVTYDCAVGWDGISASLLKTCLRSLVPPITYICNLCIEIGVFTDSVKKAIVHPIYKGGKRNCVDNYRPTSVLSSLSKILERILSKNLRSFLNKYKTIADNQYGFRSGVSTEDAVLDLTQSKTLDSRSKCLGVFLDLSKAFDTVFISILISKLQYLGVRGIALEIFKDYLSNRSQRVKIDSSYSDEEVVSYQGLVLSKSILGPTLFLIYINDLCSM